MHAPGQSIGRWGSGERWEILSQETQGRAGFLKLEPGLALEYMITAGFLKGPSEWLCGPFQAGNQRLEIGMFDRNTDMDRTFRYILMSM